MNSLEHHSTAVFPCPIVQLSSPPLGRERMRAVGGNSLGLVCVSSSLSEGGLS